jgi:glyoxylase-like metal-dependent hydrolase (beta-lactamase superfamily II)
MLDRQWTDPLPIFAWVIEHPEGIIIVDTGETARTAQAGYFPWWHPYYHLGVRAQVDPQQEIGPQLQELGIAPRDVRWLVMTHLHTDHAGGLHHFPNSEILVSRAEMEAASGLMGRARGYLNQHWPDWFSPRLVDFVSGGLGPFPQSVTLTARGDVHLVPTPGHTAGHLSVIVQDGDRSIFIAGDTSYNESLLWQQVVDGVAPDVAVAKQTLQRILSYVRSQPTVYLPSHDPRSAVRLASGLNSTPGAATAPVAPSSTMQPAGTSLAR